jgi:hypothetical protein
VKLSAYVFSNITDAVYERFQNWTDWIQKGFVDFLVPGAYTKDMKDFKDRVSRVLNVTGWQVPIYMGIGVHAFKNEVQIPERIVEQINITRTLGAEGQVFFRWFGYSDGEYLPLNNELAKALKIAYHNQTYIPHKLTRLVDTLPSIVYSNSTIKSLHFNFTEKSIMIQVTGPKDTTGFTTIKLPQTVMDNDWSGNVTILLDGTPWPFTKVIAYDWIYLTVEYGHEKVHEIKIMIPEFSTLTLTIFILTILLLCIFMKRENIGSPSYFVNNIRLFFHYYNLMIMPESKENMDKKKKVIFLHIATFLVIIAIPTICLIKIGNEILTFLICMGLLGLLLYIAVVVENFERSVREGKI